MTNDTVLYEVSKGVARIIRNRPCGQRAQSRDDKGRCRSAETAAKDESIRASCWRVRFPKRFPLELDLNIMFGKSKQKCSADSFRSFTSDFTTPSTIWASLPSRPLEARRVAVG